MVPSTGKRTLKVSKYPNRRFYDASRSVHVTLDDLYQLIIEGHDIEVTDSKTNDDITNLVLMQIILDRDPPKLELLNAGFLHYVLRSNRQVLRAFFDRYFGHLVNGYSAFQKQMESMMRQSATSNPMMAPAMDLAESMMQMFNPGTSSPNGSTEQSPIAVAPESQAPNPEPSLNQLQEQFDALRQEMARLRSRQVSKRARKRK